MAKASKPKKTIEEIVVPEIETPIEETVFEPESIKSEEVELGEIKKLEITGEQKEVMLQNLNLPIPNEEIIIRDNNDGMHTVSLLRNENLSMEEKIAHFMDSRPDGEVKMNDFLKSLYPIPTHGEPAVYLRQGEMRILRGLLIKMQNEGKILFADNNFMRLGDFYYEKDIPETKYHNILTIPILAKK